MSRLAWIAGTTSVALVAGASLAYAIDRKRGNPYANLPPPPTDEPPSGWIFHRANDPGYPFDAAVLHPLNVPTPGSFVDIGDSSGEWDPSKGFDSLVRVLLGSALAMAGNDPKIAQAEGKDPNAQLGRALRKAVRDSLIIPGGTNDLLYGQTNANLSGGVDPGKPCVHGSSKAPCKDGIRDANSTPVTYMMNSAGRGLNWLPRHANNLARIPQRQPLLRATALDGRRLPNVEGGHHMILWLPAYSLELLSPSQATPSIGYTTWPDGSSTSEPPPSVRSLGIDLSGVEIPVGQGG